MRKSENPGLRAGEMWGNTNVEHPGIQIRFFFEKHFYFLKNKYTINETTKTDESQRLKQRFTMN